MQYNIEIRALDLLSTKGLPNKTPKETKNFHASVNFLHENNVYSECFIGTTTGRLYRN